MKKIVVLILALCMSVDAYAFGGGGHGRTSKRYKTGVEAIGVHVDPEKPIIPPDFRDCKDNETAVIGKCCPNDLIYTEKDEIKCCDGGNEVLQNGTCVVVRAGYGKASLQENGNDFTFTWSQSGMVNGRMAEFGPGSWVLHYESETRSMEVHDYTGGGDGALQEKIWYPSSFEEIENTPLKTNDISSWLKELFGIKKAAAWTFDCVASQGNASYGYLYNMVCSGCANGSTPDSLGRCGFNTDEWQKVSLMDQCVQEKGSWRFCVCDGVLKKNKNNWVCECPDGGVGSGLGTGSTCCKDGYAYDGTGYNRVDWQSIRTCGCPSGYTQLEDDVCCAPDNSSVGGSTGPESHDMRCECASQGKVLVEYTTEGWSNGETKMTCCPKGSYTVDSEGNCCGQYEQLFWKDGKVQCGTCIGGVVADWMEGYRFKGSVCCPAGSNYVTDADGCCSERKDGKKVCAKTQFCEDINWTRNENLFTFYYKVGCGDEYEAGSWTLEYDADANTYKVTDYYRATTGELKTVVWYASGFEEVENTPVKQGNDHAFLNKLKELFGVKSATAASIRAGSKNDKWSEFKNAIECYVNGGTWKEGGMFSRSRCECPIQDSDGNCCMGDTPLRRQTPNLKKYVCCPLGESADDDGVCCNVPQKEGSVTKCCPSDKPVLHVYYNNPIIPAEIFMHSYGVCCPIGSIVDEDHNCCPPGVGTVNGKCCSEAAPHPVLYYDEDGWPRYTCCPQNVYSADKDGNCSPACPEGEKEDSYGVCCKRKNQFYVGWNDLKNQSILKCCPDNSPYLVGEHCCATENCCDSSTQKIVRNYGSDGTYIGSVCCDKTYETARNGICCKGEDCCLQDEFFSNGICCKIGQRVLRDSGLGRYHCCDADYSHDVTESGECCKNDVTEDGICCPDDKPKAVDWGKYFGQEVCCPRNSPGADSNKECCTEDQHVLTYEKDDQTIRVCCAKNSLGVDKNGHCCSSDSTTETATVNSANLCCAEGVIAKDRLGRCCAVGSEVNSAGECCPEGMKADGAGSCCSQELPQKVSLGRYSFCCATGVVAVDSSGCCPPGVSAKRSSTYPYDYLCCTENKPKVFTKNHSLDQICCPAGTEGVDSDGNCCMGDTPVGGGSRCCPANKPNAIPHGDGAVCCASDVTAVDVDGNCCPAQTGVDADGNCCPADKPQMAWYEVSGHYKRICCPAGVLQDGGVDREGNCCPPNTGVNAAGICCPTGQQSDRDGNCVAKCELSNDNVTEECCVAKGGTYTVDDETNEVECCVDDVTAMNWLHRLFVKPAYAAACYRACKNGYKRNDQGKCVEDCPEGYTPMTKDSSYVCCELGKSHYLMATAGLGTIIMNDPKICCGTGIADDNYNCCVAGEKVVNGQCSHECSNGETPFCKRSLDPSGKRCSIYGCCDESVAKLSPETGKGERACCQTGLPYCADEYVLGDFSGKCSQYRCCHTNNAVKIYGSSLVEKCCDKGVVAATIDGCCPVGADYNPDTKKCCNENEEVVEINGTKECKERCREDQTRNTETGECKDTCESPMTWDSEKQKCMCPEGVEPTEKDGKKYCCAYSAEWDGNNYNLINSRVCGCSNGYHDPSKGFNGCCAGDNMFIPDGSGPSVIPQPNIAACGCVDDDQPSKSGSGCCGVGYGVYTEGTYYDDQDTNERINIAECGCIADWYEVNGESGKMCCDNEYAGINDGAFTGGYTSSQSIYCCQDRDGNWQYDDEFCCTGNGGNWTGEVCCDSYNTGYLLNSEETDYEHCGCPSGYDYGNDGITCCSQENKGKDISGNNNFAQCGCPLTWDGEPGEYKNGTCCYKGIEWIENTNGGTGGPDYNGLNVDACGCPNGLDDASRNMRMANPGYKGCCTTDNMFAEDGKEINTNPSVGACGCLKGSETSVSGKGCCWTDYTPWGDDLRGMYYDDNSWNVVDAAECHI